MKIKVLIVDDNLESGKTLKWIMEAEGYEVCLATNGMTALNETRDYIPDVVLSDLSMPKVDGYEMCKKMKGDERFKDTLFIAQTGLNSSNAKLLSLKAGYDHYFVKPIDFKILLKLIPQRTSVSKEGQ